MNVKQIHTLINNVTKEVLGTEELILEDLTNIVDVGTQIFNANAVDRYVQSLVNHIGKVIFVDRPYYGKVPSVIMDAWEFGSVLEKISADIPKATENDTWELTDAKAYPQDVFYKPSVSAKFFNSKVTFEVPMSITERQVKQSFSNATQLNGFLSMLYSAVDKSMTIKMDALVMRTINNMIGETLVKDANVFSEDEGVTVDYASGSTTRCVNLLYLYNEKFEKDLTVEQSIYDAEFIRFATYIMSMYIDRMGSISTLFNIGGKERFTPASELHLVLLSDFAKSADTYLNSDVKHNEFVRLPKHETVPFWQASGDDYSFENVSSINIKTSGSKKTIEMSGILGVMFDRDALGVTNLDRRVTSTYNAKAEFYNNYYKFDAGYFNDTNENFVLFYVADSVLEGNGNGE